MTLREIAMEVLQDNTYRECDNMQTKSDTEWPAAAKEEDVDDIEIDVDSISHEESNSNRNDEEDPHYLTTDSENTPVGSDDSRTSSSADGGLEGSHPRQADSPLPRITNFFINDILKPDFGRKRTDSKTECNFLTDYGEFRDRSSDEKGGTLSDMHRLPSTRYRDVERRRQKDDNIVWPAWVYCTRYSDRPSSGPRSKKSKRRDRRTDEKRPRTAFTNEQLSQLKQEFDENRYLTEDRRKNLARQLNLNESQIKIWFQNKRAKMKKATGVRNHLALQLMAQGLYNHTATSTNLNSRK